MLAGTVIAERFAVEERAAGGGMAEVYRARDQRTNKPVALKLLTPAAATDTDRFVREAQLLAELRHPNIVRYIAHGVTRANQRYLVMDWLDGEDLAQRLGREPLSLRDSVELIRRVALALGYAHERGIVHRDVKPSNLFLPEGRVDDVKLLDFGVARVRASSMTVNNLVVGTPGYMAPEQARGLDSVDARADVFSLGSVLFECVAGRPAFVGDSVMAVLAKILLQQMPSLSDTEAPPALRDLVARMLAKEPDDRPAGGAEVAALLEHLDLQVPVQHAAPAPPQPRELTDQEQRLLSVLVIRSGGRDRDDQTLATVTEEHAAERLEQLRATVARFGGALEVLAEGSVIVTMMGSGLATDQVANAARCGLRIRDQLPGATIGLATGRGIVGDAMPMGEAIDRAVRLVRSRTSPERDDGGRLLIDDVSASLLDTRFVIGGGRRNLELEAERQHAPSERLLLGRRTSCVGRERELATLEGIWRQCTGEAVAQAVVLVGAAGMGKSRIRSELVQRLRAGDTGFELFIARGDPMSAGSAFGLLGPALRREAGLQDGEALEAQRRKLRARVSRHVTSDTQRVAEFLGELAGVPFDDADSVPLRTARADSALMGDQMLRAWEDFIAAECAAQPVLFVIEDLHWGDRPTVKYIDAALRHAASSPLLVLATARPSVDELFGQLWHRRPVTRLSVVELSAQACRSLAREVLDDAPDHVIDQVVERAAGNALYLEELIRAVAAGRGSALPESVLAMVHARLDALEPEARRTLRAASVFGQAFWRGGVAALLGQGVRNTQVSDWLDELCERELLARRGQSRFPAEHELVFRHGLVREAAYAMLTEHDRALGHRMAGTWLAEAGETDAMVLAEHFDRGGAAQLAARWLHRAAQQALDAHDFDAVVARAQRALDAGASGVDRGGLLLLQAEAQRWRGALRDAAELAREALAVLPAGSALWYRGVTEAISSSDRRAEYDVVARLVGDARGAQPGPDAATARLACLASAARQMFHAGEYALSDELLEVISDAVGPDAPPLVRADVARLRGARARHVGDLVGDFVNYEAALRAFEAAGDARQACNARVSLAFAHIELGQLDLAERQLERALASAQRMGLSTVATRARQNLGLALAARGELVRARALIDAVIEQTRAQGNRRFEGWTRIYSSNLARAAGDLETAELEARAAGELLRVTPPAYAGARAAQALAALGLGRVADALDMAREAVALLDAHGGIEEFEPLVRLAHAETTHASGDHAAARAAISAAAAVIHGRADAVAALVDRETFLSRVPENAAIAARYADWVGDAGGAGPFDAEVFRRHGHRVVDRLAEYLRAVASGELPVMAWREPDDMLAQWPVAEPAELSDLVERVLTESAHQHHRRYLGYQVTPPYPVAALAELVASLLNNGMAGYDSGPAASAIEAAVVDWFGDQVGWAEGDGVLCSGGSIGNLTALLAARQRKAGFDLWRAGAHAGPPLAVLTNASAHYSVQRAVQIMGWGQGGAVAVADDDGYRMDVADLAAAADRASAAGRTVIAVVATAGSSSTGAIDPLPDVAAFCRERDLWLHVDAAHGASALLSPRYRGLLDGIELADSLVWDAHKLMGLPALASVLLFRDAKASYAGFAQRASYVFSSDDQRWFDRGMRTVECTKRMIGVPLYMTLALVGPQRIGADVTVMFDRARELAQLIAEHDRLELVCEPVCNMVCFRVAGADDAGHDRIRDAVRAAGFAFLARAVVDERVCLRATIMNPLTSRDHLVEVIDHVVAMADR